MKTVQSRVNLEDKAINWGQSQLVIQIWTPTSWLQPFTGMVSLPFSDCVHKRWTLSYKYSYNNMRLSFRFLLFLWFFFFTAVTDFITAVVLSSALVLFFCFFLKYIRLLSACILHYKYNLTIVTSNNV